MDAAFAYDVPMRRADSLAEVELRQMARQQALAMEFVEALGEIQSEAADRTLAAVGGEGRSEDIVY